MSPDTPEHITRELADYDALELREDGCQIASITFDSELSVDTGGAESAATEKLLYTLTVHVPSLKSATVDDVGTAVGADWFRTLKVRLVDAPKSTRRTVDIDSCTVERDGDEVLIEYIFRCESPKTAADIAKAFAEYVEGTYVESVIPGYEYEPPVATLLSQASQGEKGGTPL